MALTAFHAVQVASVHMRSAGKVGERQAVVGASARELVGEIRPGILTLTLSPPPMGGGDSETLASVPFGCDRRPMSSPNAVVGCAFPCTWSTHGGPREILSLVISRHGGDICLDPHATGTGVLKLDEDTASEVCETIQKWLG
jgi:hypothetical protein